MRHIIKITIKLLALASIMTLSQSCDYWGVFTFEINNNTEESLTISYQHSEKSSETVHPNTRRETEVASKNGNASGYNGIKTVTMDSGESLNVSFDVGQVSSNFPTKNDVPESYGIIPLWDAIKSMAIGNDILPRNIYSKDKWVASHGILFTLDINEKPVDNNSNKNSMQQK